MNIVIVGQGAMGLLWYHHLQQNTEINVSIRPSCKPTDSTTSYFFTSLTNNTSKQTLYYANDQDIAQADVIFFMVKSYQVTTAFKQLAPLITTKTAIILAHNGMGSFDEMAAEVKQKYNFFAMITTQACLREKPLHIVHTGQGHSQIGQISKPLTDDISQQLIQLLNDVLPTVSFHHNIIEEQWQKLAINCVINPLTALYDHKNGEINQEKYQSIIKSILTEVVNIAKSQQVILSLDNLLKSVEKVAKATAENSSSMRCDLRNNNFTEIDYINGYIHRLGLSEGIATKENTLLWQLISAKASQDD